MAPAMNAQPDVNQPRTPATDSRALQNLIKAEKTYVENLFSTTSAAMSAASALQAWGMSETPDMEQATMSVSKWLEEASSAQRTHGQAIDQYREALKDVLEREHSIRGILRDREILISRVIKNSKRKPSRWEVINGDDDNQARIAEAQRELHACEQLLANESALLVGVKRRTFKEALAMRVKTMGDSGAVMMDSARAILEYLDQFDANVPVAPMPPAPMPEELTETGAPASTVGASSVIDHGLDHELPPPPPEARSPVATRPPMEVRAPPQEAPAAEVRSPLRAERRTSAQVATEARSPSAQPSEPAEVRKPRKTRSRAPSDASRVSASLVHVPQVPGGVPSAPRVNLDHMRSGFVAPTIPGGVPSAPRAMHVARDDNSSDDEVPRRRNDVYGTPTTTDASVAPRRARHHYQESEEDAHERRSGKGGFFNRMSNLFRTEVRAAPTPAKRERSTPRAESLFAPIGDIPKSRGARDDSSDDEPAPNVVRHVNERPGSSMSSRNLLSPASHRGSSGMRRSSSVMGRAASAAPVPEDDELMAAVRRSVIGAGISGTPNKSNRPPSRASSAMNVATAQPRAARRNSVDLGESALNRPGSANSTRKVRTRSSSEQLGEKTTTTTRRKRRDSSTTRPTGPPPAPSSFYVGFSNNPAKYATDSWVAKAEDASATAHEAETPSRTASGQGRARPSSVISPSSSRTQPLKPALKASKGATTTPKRLSLQETPDAGTLSLDVDRRFDGTGHLDLELGELISTGTSPTKGARTPDVAPLASRAEPSHTFWEQPSTENHGGLAPPLVGLPSFYGAPRAQAGEASVPHTTPAAQASAPAVQAPAPSAAPSVPAPSASPNARKSVRIDSEAPKATEPEAEEDLAPGGRARSSWSTRIGARDDSSDEETEPGNPDGYNNARKAFGSATRHLGLATGTIQPKPKSEARKKKTRDLDYNPSVQLPPGLQSIAHSR